ncbi:MAG: cytochrome c [Gammaproteobacteria bacterium]|nr:cytochrome c [Gammaproteobacteria bacterium]MBU1442084.1 cytochrome c [Gammaproteobacteria bacterium]
MKRSAQLVVVAMCLSPWLSATAQFAKPEDAVKYRQSAMFIQGQHFGRLAAMANGRVPYDAGAAAANAEVVASIARLPWAAYGPGTEGGKAKPEIWTESAKFKELGDKLTADTGKLVDASKAGNLDALKVAVQSVGETCKSCHDTFRSK